jgi:phosphoribosylformimino-5-aminoimidazole carboxamide ribotide isomerase
MLIIPAIDLKEGVCVRLMQGRFDDVTDYGDPFVRLRSFADAGATWVHIVDLDGARLGRPAQHDLIARLAGETGLKVQCGGGVRSREHVETLLSAGVARVVIGSAVVREPKNVRSWIEEFGVEKICAALDVRRDADDWEVVIHGWTAGAGVSLGGAFAEFPPNALAHILVTDVSRDGALTGPNVSLMQEIQRLRPDLTLQASGGVSSLNDLRTLRAAGAGAAIVGRALYERCFTLEAALAV